MYLIRSRFKDKNQSKCLGSQITEDRQEKVCLPILEQVAEQDGKA